MTNTVKMIFWEIS